MVLEVVDSVHASSLLNELRVLVDRTRSSGLFVELSDLENVLETVEGDLDNLVVHRLEEVAQRLDATLGDEVPDLLRLLKTARGGVGKSPASLLLGLEIRGLKDVDERRDDVGVDDGLDLMRAGWREQVHGKSASVEQQDRARSCAHLPAVQLEIVQHASLRIPSLGLERSCRSAESAPEAMTTWVWRSSPVTMLPTERRAGV